MPPPQDWSIWEDSLTDLYRLAARLFPTLAFADLSSTEDHVQKTWFLVTGGKQDGKDCCLDGCGCPEPPQGSTGQPHGVRGGRLDWTKTRKVTLLQRRFR